MSTLHYHTSATCIPCIALKPKVKKLAEEYGVTFREHKVDEGDAFVSDILSVPTIILERGGVIVARLDANYSSPLTVRKMLKENS